MGALPEVQWDVEQREEGALSLGVQYFPAPLHGVMLKGSSDVGSSSPALPFLSHGSLDKGHDLSCLSLGVFSYKMGIQGPTSQGC